MIPPLAVDDRIARAQPRWWIVGGALFLLAAVVRLLLLDTARFTHDEALFFAVASDILDGRSLPLLGAQLTAGEARLPGPLSSYLLTLPVLVWRAPEAQFVFVQLLGAATVVVFWQALRAPFGERGAAFAGALLACAPWAVLYADRPWNPNVLPLFVAIGLLCAVRLRQRPSAFAPLALLLPTCAAMAQIHPSAPVAWTGIAVLVASTARAWNRRAFLLGFVVSVVLFVPALAHELSTSFSNTRHLWAETIAGTGSAEDPRSPVPQAARVPMYAARFLTLDVTYHELSGYWGPAGEFAYLKGALFGTPPRPFHPLRLFAFLLSVALAAKAVVVWARAAWRASRRRLPPTSTSMPHAILGRALAAVDAAPFAYAFLAALAANMALIAITGKPVFGHYVTNLMLFAFVAYAALGRAVLDAAIAPTRRVLLAAGLVFMAGGVEASLAISRRVDGRNGLATQRATLAAIRADGARDGNVHEPVSLDVAYRTAPSNWQILAERTDPDLPRVRFDANARTRRYRLIERGAPAPPDSVSDRQVGHAVLHRLE